MSRKTYFCCVIQILNFLSKHQFLNVIVCLAFFLLVTLPHEFVGVSVAAVFKGVSRKTYDLTILCLGLLILLLFISVFYRQIRKLQNPFIPISFFSLCIILMIVSLHSLIIVNIEIIHFIQYALMAVLIFPLLKNFLSTLIFVTLLGSIDEAYQYYFLSPDRTNYYDFNDVILNLLGAAIGLIFLRSHRGIASILRVDRYKIHTKAWLSYTFFIGISTMLIWQKKTVQTIIDRLGLDLDWETYGAILIRKPTTSFWTEIPPKILYHVVQPIEGVIIVSILLITFGFIYYKAE